MHPAKSDFSCWILGPFTNENLSLMSSHKSCTFSLYDMLDRKVGSTVFSTHDTNIDWTVHHSSISGESSFSIATVPSTNPHFFLHATKFAWHEPIFCSFLLKAELVWWSSLGYHLSSDRKVMEFSFLDLVADLWASHLSFLPFLSCGLSPMSTNLSPFTRISISNPCVVWGHKETRLWKRTKSP